MFPLSSGRSSYSSSSVPVNEVSIALLSSPRRRPGSSLPRLEPSKSAGTALPLLGSSEVTESWVPAYAGTTREVLALPIHSETLNGRALGFQLLRIDRQRPDAL